MQEPHRTGENRDSILGGHTQVVLHTKTQDKSNKRSLGQTYLLVLEGLLGRQGAAVALSGVINAGGRNIGECSCT